jgi:phosphoheptose isomerase
MRNVVSHARAVHTAVDYASRKAVYACGNGPSATDAGHWQLIIRDNGKSTLQTP